MEWVAIILLTASLSASVDKEFSTAKECWDYYNIESNYTQIGSPVLTQSIRLYKDKNTKELIWLTCERKDQLTGNDISKFPLNILLPTPT